ncbi:zinc ribbon domain-containing protein [Polyangium sp. 6x1]|uniref:double zinc ribbon domain-containing protein n=1 Tax=Polyangium sp. 6x1 TaxID=3042689 RepID=UPI0024822444|nr:zinc ribbon domain-containing protein [Polyangium sp. 6x1]MDI1448078.1 zinc ribbon domain-containing protein [Polyangium sp. 6x1]
MTSGSAEGRCVACGTDVPAEAAVCPRCGTSQRMEVCPHCGATAGATRDAELRYRCDVCGGPRVPLGTKKMRRSGKEIGALKRAELARKGRAKNRAAAAFTGVALAGTIGILAIYGLLGVVGVVNPGFGFFLASLLTAGPLAGLVAWLLARSRARGKEIEPALDEAWLSVAADVAAQIKGPVTARALADALPIAESQAEEMLALLEAHEIVRNDGSLTRMRIGASADKPDLAAVEAEVEAEAEAEARAPGVTREKL